MGVDRCVADGASESGGGAGRPDIAGGRRVLTRQSEIEHEDPPAGMLDAAHGKIGLQSIPQTKQLYSIQFKSIKKWEKKTDRFDVAMEETHFVNTLNGFEDLQSET